jgi:hypothetical protein|nr:MAG TPA: hypothetical protein [Microviridae sp.]
MEFYHYELVIFFDSVKEPIEHDFYCIHSRLPLVVQSILKDYDLNSISYYVIHAL